MNKSATVTLYLLRQFATLVLDLKGDTHLSHAPQYSRKQYAIFKYDMGQVAKHPDEGGNMPTNTKMPRSTSQDVLSLFQSGNFPLEAIPHTSTDSLFPGHYLQLSWRHLVHSG